MGSNRSTLIADAPARSSAARFSGERATAVTRCPAAMSCGTTRLPISRVAPLTYTLLLIALPYSLLLPSGLLAVGELIPSTSPARQTGCVGLELAQPAVRNQFGTDKEAGLVGRQEHRRVGDLARIPETLERDALSHLRGELLARFGAEPQPVEDGGSDRPRTDHVDANAPVHELGRERTSQGPHRRLARRVDARARHAQQA